MHLSYLRATLISASLSNTEPSAHDNLPGWWTFPNHLFWTTGVGKAQEPFQVKLAWQQCPISPATNNEGCSVTVHQMTTDASCQQFLASASVQFSIFLALSD